MPHEHEAKNPLASAAVLQGHVNIRVFGSDGQLKESREITNTITSLGKIHVADQLSAAPTQAPMSSLAVGSGTPSTTALGAESFRRAFRTRSASGSVVTYVAHWDIDDQKAGTLTEAGIFNSPSLGGVMLCSAVISPPVVKGLNDSLDITWTVRLS